MLYMSEMLGSVILCLVFGDLISPLPPPTASRFSLCHHPQYLAFQDPIHRRQSDWVKHIATFHPLPEKNCTICLERLPNRLMGSRGMLPCVSLIR